MIVALISAFGELTTNEQYLVSLPNDPTGSAGNGAGYEIVQSTNGRITIVVPTPSLSPTTFGLSGTTARVTEGVGSPLPISNSRIEVSELTFENLSEVETPGIIRIEFTLTHINPDGRNEYDYQQTFYGSASLREQ